MTYAIKHLFHINAPRSDVYEAISTIEGLSGWWTKLTSGSAREGGTIQFRFGEAGPDMKVISTIEDEVVKWECVASPHGWLGHRLQFSLDENEGKTRVRFSHAGFPEEDDLYAICTFSWGRFMESLRQYCQTGKGEPFSN